MDDAISIMECTTWKVSSLYHVTMPRKDHWYSNYKIHIICLFTFQKKGQISPSEFKENYILHSSSEYCALPKKLDLVRQHKQ